MRCPGFSWRRLLLSQSTHPVGKQASEVAVRAPEHRLDSCGTGAQLPRCVWDLPGSGIKPRVFCTGRQILYHRASGDVLCAVLSRSVVSDSLRSHGLQPPRLLCPWDSPGKNTGVGCHALLQGIFPTQGSNPGLPHCRQILSHRGSPTHQEINNANFF